MQQKWNVNKGVYRRLQICNMSSTLLWLLWKKLGHVIKFN